MESEITWNFSKETTNYLVYKQVGGLEQKLYLSKNTDGRIPPVVKTPIVAA